MKRKKGLAIQQVFWILVMVIVIAVVGMIFIKEKVLASEEGEELSELFGKGTLTTGGDEELKVESNKVDSKYQYTVRVENLNFYYKILEENGEEELQFIAIADFKDKVAMGYKDNGSAIISYPEDKNIALNFVLESKEEPENKEFLHLTFWRDSKCIDDFLGESGGGGGGGDFYDLLAKCPKYYISSVDVGEWMGRAINIKFDVGESELWEFHLTNDPNHNTDNTCGDWKKNPASITSDQCIILANEEDGFLDWPPWNAGDECALTTAAPGSLISSGYSNIQQGLNNAVCRPADDACDILTESWTTTNTIGDKCKQCDERLLTKNGKFNFIPKIDIICDNNGFWVPCNSNRENKVIIIGGNSYTCINSEWMAATSPKEGVRIIVEDVIK